MNRSLLMLGLFVSFDGIVVTDMTATGASPTYFNYIASPTFDTLAQNLSPRIARIGVTIGF